MAKSSTKGSGKPIPKVKIRMEPSPEQIKSLLETLEERFEKQQTRHNGVAWHDVRAALEAKPERLSSLYAMESTGGEPDVVDFDGRSNTYTFMDCSEQSPEGRRSICYDGDGQAEREKKGIHPGGNAVDLAAAMGIELLDEDQYRQLQTLGEFDTKTESWLRTPDEMRKLGGAVFGDRRYGRVFVFHNSAPSFYASRGFRGALVV